MQLTGNTILITGATSGIGLAFAQELSKLGNTILAIGRDPKKLHAIQQQHPEFHIHVADVANETDRRELLQWVTEHHPDTNVVINNAGIQLKTDLTSECNLHDVRHEIETNLVAPLHIASLFSGFLAAKTNAALVNITSGLAFVPIAFMPVYCATKAALHSATLSLRHQLKHTPVNVFEIIPPSVDTNLGYQRRADASQSHGGMPIEEFIAEAIAALQNDIFEAPIAAAKGLRQNGEAMFPMLNK
jgi:uncharacterized oxidoreductase